MYTARILIGLCCGTITNIGQIWKDKNIVTLANEGLSLFTGSTTQVAWGEMTTYHPERALNYRHLAYVAGNINLGNNATVPNYTFEVLGKNIYGSGIEDANPADVIYDLLTNTVYGAGFPTANIDDLTDYSNYCIANGIFISPIYSQQQEAHQLVSDIIKITNSEFVWSQGLLKIVPYGDTEVIGNGVTWTPDLTPLYDLDYDHYLFQDNPITCKRSLQADIFNSYKLEILNRDNSYNVETIEAQDQASKEIYGDRPADTIQAHIICDTTIGKKVVQLLLDKGIVFRNKYIFKLPLNYILLDPMDLITITSDNFGLDRKLVRVLSITESDNNELEFEVLELTVGSATPALYEHETTTRTNVNYNGDAGNSNPAVFIEPPFTLTQNQLQVWIGASGISTIWGGAFIWVSEDGETYKKIGKIDSPIRQGELMINLPVSVTDIDGTNTLSVDLTMSRSSILSGTYSDMLNFNTLCYVDGELLSYQTATLTDDYMYDITLLNRGAYGSSNSLHTIGSQFVKIDEPNFFKYAFKQEDIGKTIFVKVQSFNIYGGGVQDLSLLSPYTYTLLGTALLEAPSDITDLTTFYREGYTYLKFTAVNDSRIILYEVRKGDSWELSTIVGRFSSNEILANGDGTYLIKAYVPSMDIYSENYESVEILGSRVTQNVIATYDEHLAWGGTLTNCYESSGSLRLTDTSQTGYYEIPNAHKVDIGEAQLCYVSYSYNLLGDTTFGDVDSVTDFDSVDNLDGDYSSYVSGSKVQIRLAQNDGVYGDWQDITQAQYFARKFDFRAVLISSNLDITPVLTTFTVTVDVPDLIQTGNNVLVESTGLSVTFDKEYQITPNVQITIIDKHLHDNPVITNTTTAGFDIIITNDFDDYAEIATERYINWTSIGY